MACAEVELQRVQWQIARAEKGKPKKTQDIDTLALAPGGRLPARLIARLTLLNRGAARKAILLRYCVSAKIAPVAAGQEGSWALPFLLEERRIPAVGANQHYDVPIEPTTLTALYLKKIFREGYWPESLKLQVMLEPRAGDPKPVQIIEAILPLKNDRR